MNNNEPDYHYAAFLPCGCLVGLCVDLRDRDTAESVAEWVKNGCYIERHQRDTLKPLLDAKGFGCKCPKQQPELFAHMGGSSA